MQPLPARPPARRALAVHAGWEAFLLVACIALVIVIGVRHPHPPALWKALAGSLSVLLLQAVAVAVSLRARNLNFAVIAITFIAAYLVADWTGAHGMSLLVAALLAVLLATVVGAVLGAVAGLTRAPGWAASVLLFALIAALGLARGVEPVKLPDAQVPDNPATWSTLLIVLGLVGSVAGGVLWQLVPVRRALGVERDQPASASARVLGGVVGLGLSSGLAALAGVAYVIYTLMAFPAQVGGLPLTPLAIVIFGGVSVYGGRGGFAGTALAAIGAALLTLLFRLDLWPLWFSTYLLPAIMLAVGIALSVVLRQVSADNRVVPAPIWSPTPPPGFGPPPPFPAAMVPPGYPPAPGHPAPVQPGPGHPAPVQPAPGQLTPGQSTPGQPTPGQPTPGQPGAGLPASGQPGPAQSGPVAPAAGGQ